VWECGGGCAAMLSAVCTGAAVGEEVLKVTVATASFAAPFADFSSRPQQTVAPH